MYLDAQRLSQQRHKIRVLPATELARIIGSPTSTITRWQLGKVPITAAEIIAHLAGANRPKDEEIDHCLQRRMRDAIAYAEEVRYRSSTSQLRQISPIEWLLLREADPGCEIPKAN